MAADDTVQPSNTEKFKERLRQFQKNIDEQLAIPDVIENETARFLEKETFEVQEMAVFLKHIQEFSTSIEEEGANISNDTRTTIDLIKQLGNLIKKLIRTQLQEDSNILEVKSLEGEIESLEGEIESLEGEIESLEGEIESLSDKSNKVNKYKDGISQTSTHLIGKLKSNHKIYNLTTEWNELNELKDEPEEDIQKLKEDADKIYKEYFDTDNIPYPIKDKLKHYIKAELFLKKYKKLIELQEIKPQEKTYNRNQKEAEKTSKEIDEFLLLWDHYKDTDNTPIKNSISMVISMFKVSEVVKRLKANLATQGAPNYNALDNEIKALTEDIKNLRKEINDTTAEKDNTTAAKETNTKTVNYLKLVFDLPKKEEDLLQQAKVLGLEEEISELEEARKQVTEIEPNDPIAQLDEKIEKLKPEINTLASKLNVAVGEQEQLTSEIIDLEAKIAGLDSTITDLKSKIEKSGTAIIDLRVKIADLGQASPVEKEQLEQLEAEEKQLEAEKEQLEAEKEKFKKNTELQKEASQLYLKQVTLDKILAKKANLQQAIIDQKTTEKQAKETENTYAEIERLFLLRDLYQDDAVRKSMIVNTISSIGTTVVEKLIADQLKKENVVFTNLDTSIKTLIVDINTQEEEIKKTVGIKAVSSLNSVFDLPKKEEDLLQQAREMGLEEEISELEKARKQVTKIEPNDPTTEIKQLEKEIKDQQLKINTLSEEFTTLTKINNLDSEVKKLDKEILETLNTYNALKLLDLNKTELLQTLRDKEKQLVTKNQELTAEKDRVKKDTELKKKVMQVSLIWAAINQKLTRKANLQQAIINQKTAEKTYAEIERLFLLRDLYQNDTVEKSVIVNAISSLDATTVVEKLTADQLEKNKNNDFTKLNTTAKSLGSEVIEITKEKKITEEKAGTEQEEQQSLKSLFYLPEGKSLLQQAKVLGLEEEISELEKAREQVTEIGTDDPLVEIGRLKEEISELETTIKKPVQELSVELATQTQLTSEIIDLEAKIKTLTSEITDLEAKIKTLTSEFIKPNHDDLLIPGDKEVNELIEQKLAAGKEELKAINHEKLELETEKLKLQLKLKVEKHRVKEDTELQKKIGQVSLTRAAINQKLTRKANLQQAIINQKTAEKTYAEIERLFSLRDLYQDDTVEKSVIVNAISSLDATTVVEKLKKAQQEDNNQDFIILDDKTKTLRGAIDKLKVQIKQTATEKNSITAVNSLKREFNLPEKKEDLLQEAKVLGLEEEIRELEEARKQVTKIEPNNPTAEIEQLEEEIKDQQLKINELLKELDNAFDTQTQLTSEIKSLGFEIEILDSEIEILDSKIKNLNSSFDKETLLTNKEALLNNKSNQEKKLNAKNQELMAEKHRVKEDTDLQKKVMQVSLKRVTLEQKLTRKANLQQAIIDQKTTEETYTEIDILLHLYNSYKDTTDLEPLIVTQIQSFGTETVVEKLTADLRASGKNAKFNKLYAQVTNLDKKIERFEKEDSIKDFSNTIRNLNIKKAELKIQMLLLLKQEWKENSRLTELIHKQIMENVLEKIVSEKNIFEEKLKTIKDAPLLKRYCMLPWKYLYLLPNMNRVNYEKLYALATKEGTSRMSELNKGKQEQEQEQSKKTPKQFLGELKRLAQKGNKAIRYIYDFREKEKTETIAKGLGKRLRQKLENTIGSVYAKEAVATLPTAKAPLKSEVVSRLSTPNSRKSNEPIDGLVPVIIVPTFVRRKSNKITF